MTTTPNTITKIVKNLHSLADKLEDIQRNSPDDYVDQLVQAREVMKDFGIL